MLRSFDPDAERDMVFIPVGINYDRTLEDRTLLRGPMLDASPSSPGRAVATTVWFVLHNLWLMLRSRWYRFGYACVIFGSPISLRAYLSRHGVDVRQLPRQERFTRVEALGRELMTAVGAVVPVLPVSLVATVFVHHPQRALSELELKVHVYHVMRTLEERGARVYVPRHDQDYAITVGLRTLTLRHLVEVWDGLYVAQPHELPILHYYANSIAHLLPSPYPPESGVLNQTTRDSYT
jgi:glycerol-3-phosphate O-acyltransferase